MKKNNAIDIIKRMKNAKILVVGDIMLDRFVYGEVQRISPEGPVPVLFQKNESYMLGGAGNVVSNLCCLEVQVSLVSAIGQDDIGDQLREILRAKGVGVDGLVALKDKPTTLKTRYLASNQQLLRVDHEDPAALTDDAEKQIWAALKPRVEDHDVVIVSDYGKGVLGLKLLNDLMKLAKKAGVPVLVDPKGNDYKIYKGAFLVTPNRKELGEAVGYTVPQDDAAVEEAARTLMKKAGISAVVATRSEAGMSVIQKKADKATHLGTTAREVFDVSGAGDTVIATIGAALATGASLDDAATLANEAGAVVVAKIGTAPILASELLPRFLEGRQSSENVDTAEQAERVVSRAAAKDIVAGWQRDGLRVGFTNGCFDIIHQGHTTYIDETKTHCDRLILALNTDKSVKRLKGETRPVNSEGDRAAVLAALRSVDLVVLFGDDDGDNDMPCQIIDTLRPDVIFKGGDYTEDQLPEAKIARAYGGDVVIMSLVEGRSTTNIIQKMKA